MIPVDEALAILERETATLEARRMPLEAAHGLVLAEPIVADRDFPPTDRSAMDGFAVRSADVTTAGARLRVVGETRAGEPPPASTLGAGEARRIFTGAVLPPGADAVVMVERTQEDRERGTVRIRIDVPSGSHVRRRASDLAAGAVVLDSGAVVRAGEVAALASVGAVRPLVYPRPAAGVLSTGDEIVSPDGAVEPHQVRNSNAPMLRAQLAGCGALAVDLGQVGDRRDELERRLDGGLGSDVLLVTGGVSVGDYDFVRQALEAVGVRVLFHGVAVKPGKPLLAGRRGDCLVFGLPGNPLSTFTGFALFVAPVLRRLMGRRDWRDVELRARLLAPLRCRPGRRTYHLARLEHAEDGWVAGPVRSTGSGDVLALARANAFAITETDDEGVEAGARVAVLAWRDSWATPASGRLPAGDQA